MKRFRYILLLPAAVAGITAAAQDELNKEVIIERDIVPVLEQATRHDPGMTVVRPTLTQPALTYSDRAAATQTVPQAYTLEPALGAQAVHTSPYRGYVYAGWPGVTAGYRILDRDGLTLGVQAQYLHNRYAGDDYTVTANDAGARLYFGWTPRAGRMLTASLAYGYRNFSRPYIAPGLERQALGSPVLRLAWHSDTGAPFSYHAGASASLTSYAEDAVFDIAGVPADFSTAPVREAIYVLEGGIAWRGSAVSQFGLDARGQLMHYNRLAAVSRPGVIQPYSQHHRAVSTFRPYYRFTSADHGVTARLGLNVGLTSCNGTDVSVAPDINLAWNISERLGLTLDATGGTVANTVSEVADQYIWAAPMLAYRHSHIPVDAQLGVRVGPFAGASLTIYGGYARANDWLMPYAMGHDYFMTPRDVKGWHLGVRAAYSWRDIAGVAVSYEGASHGDDSGYYRWRDGARGILDASVTVTPLRALQLQAGYSVRYGRRCLTYTAPDTYAYTAMHNSADLWAGAAYAVSRPLSVYARVNNILNHEAEILPGLPDRGINFVVGAGYKF